MSRSRPPINVLPRESSPGSHAVRDAVLLAAISVLAFIVSSWLDLHERFVEWSGRYELLNLDELLVAAAVLAVAAVVLLLHVGRQARVQARRRRDAETHYDTLFWTMKNGLALHEMICDDNGRPVDYRFIAVNPAFEELTGLDGDRVVGRTVREVLPTIEESWIERYGEVALNGTVTHFEQYSSALDRHYEVTAFSPEKGMFATIFTDVTDLVKARRQLETRERFLSTLFANLPGMVYRCANDEYWTMEFVSEGCRELAGYAPEDLIGNRVVSFEDLIHPEDRDRVRDAVSRSLDRHQRFDIQYRIRTAGGKQRWVWERGKAVSDTEGNGALEGFITDVTAQHKLEEQLRQSQKLEAVGQLTSGIAHDFNNLLAVIMGNAELVATALRSDQEDLREGLEEAIGAAKSGASMIRKLMGFSRRAELKIASIDLAQVLASTYTMLHRILPESIDVKSLADPSPVTLRADAVAIEQILLNLATNARDAMPEGGSLEFEMSQVTLGDEHQKAHPWVVAGEYVCLSVTDSGTGMDAETLERIFDPFFTTKPVGIGTGLGMSMIYGLMKQHDGFVHVYSELGEGTNVKLYFPLVEDAEAGVGVQTPESEAHGGTETILLVEDEEALRRTGERALDRLGYTVITATNGQEALQICRARSAEIDLVISDIVMPLMGGAALYEALQRERIPMRFIFASGYTERDVREDMAPNPEIPVLQKPWSLSELANQIREALGEG